jgi:hypothetical protein
MIININKISFILAFLFSIHSYSQIHCGSVELVPNTTIDSYLIFDDFTKYSAGITHQSVARVRIIVEDKTTVDPLCSWSLTMSIDNNSGAGTPMNEWEEITQYGNGNGINIPMNALEVRVRNSCATSPSNGVFRSFTTSTDILDIIEDSLPVTPSGSCTQNINGPGSYLTNYDEFNFDIDIRVKPDFQYNPGIFRLNIKFHLEENL